MSSIENDINLLSFSSASSTFGWGPATLSNSAIDIPFAPFSKNDKLCRVADWQSIDLAKSSGKNMGSSGQRDQRSNTYGSTFGAGQSSYFSYYHVDDEMTFSTVDSKTTQSKKINHRMGQKSFQKPSSSQSSSSAAATAAASGFFQPGQGPSRFHRHHSGNGPSGQQNGNQSTGNHPFPRRRHWRDMHHGKSQRLRESSIQIGADWRIIEEIEFSRLAKLQFEPEAPEQLAEFGTVHYYDRLFDRINTKTEKNLIVSDQNYHNGTTSDDPILCKMAEQGQGQVFATDSILSMLMAAPRSVSPWDLVIRKQGQQLFLDKRDALQFDFLTVNETAAEPPIENEKDNLNSANALALEAFQVNRNFAEQVLKESESIQWESNSNSASVHPNRLGIRYRRWQFGDNLQLIARTETDALLKTPNSDANDSNNNNNAYAYLTIRAINETDPKLHNTDWRQKLDNQRGSVLATEVRNNGNKLARWVYQSLLSGSDFLKLGFISRIHPKDRTRHAILGTSQYKPEDFASQINLSWANGYGILKALFGLCLQQGDGTYVLLKDANKALLRLYALPAGTSFEMLRKGRDEEDASDA